MDVQAARGDERMLRRVIALLLAFAVLAERAAGRSAPVRLLVLWLLRRAETAAGELIFEHAGMPPPAPDEIAAVGNGPDDALSLAARFHALAAALGALLSSGCRPGRGPAQRGFAFGLIAPVAGRRRGTWTREPHDTS